MTAVYYNEFDPYAAKWLRNLCANGELPDGLVDDRDMWDVRPNDLIGYRQHHFCAGIGGWPLAIRIAGYERFESLWSISCPCQPFSTAGSRSGFADERHLWPAAFHLVSQGLPGAIVGEQVASKDGYAWLDLVWSDLEALGYTFRAVVLPVAGFGAPGERHRIFWVAHGDCRARAQGSPVGTGRDHRSGKEPRAGSGGGGESIGMGNTLCDGTEHVGGNGSDPQETIIGKHGHMARSGPAARDASAPDRLVDTDQPGPQGRALPGERADQRIAGKTSVDDRPNALDGFWRDADWLFCTDGKWRPVEPGTRPLVAGLPAGLGVVGPRLRQLATLAGTNSRDIKSAKTWRVGTLRGYGNAINVDVAVEFLRAVL